MSRAGFVLVGGKSSRMGQDKALLPFRCGRLVEHVAGAVADAAGSVTLIGDPERYGGLGYAVIPDARPGAGPLGGIHTALSASQADWNLILACDLPGVSTPFLSELLAAAERSGADCLLAAGPSGMPEPLCAAYQSRCRAAIGQALDRAVRKILDGLAELKIEVWRVPDAAFFQNCNTPEEWELYRGPR